MLLFQVYTYVRTNQSNKTELSFTLDKADSVIYVII